MTKFISKDQLAKRKDKIPFPKNFNIQEMVRKTSDEHVYEFIGSDTFGSEWNERRRFEVDAGREEEPLLYGPIYSEIRDSSLPRHVPLYNIGPGGMVFEEVKEGGEVKFGTITSSDSTAQIRQYAAGIEYSKQLVAFNELWNVPIMERQAGIAYNALLNHIHLSPFLTATYTSANQTAAVDGDGDAVQDFRETLEKAIIDSRTASEKRNGPYTLLVSSAQTLTLEKALTPVPQQGFTTQSRVIDAIQNVIVYDGWTGNRGSKSTSYAGVTSGKGYLISAQYQNQDFQSFMKQDLMQDGMQEDASRFLTQVVYDTMFGAYANVLRATQEITWPS